MVLPLELASAGGNAEIVRMLLDARASVNVGADARVTPLLLFSEILGV